MTDETRPVALLSFIRGAETSRGYEDYYRGSVIAPPKPVTTMTVREIQEWQDASVRAGSDSSAVGGYQIIRKTFNATAAALGLTGDEVFDEALQDRFGEHLLVGRGYNRWQAGEMSDEDFARNLAGEWAGLPLASGQSAYAGDGLNASTVSYGDLFGALEATRNGEQIDMSGIVSGGGGGGGDSGGVAGAARASAEARTNRISQTDPLFSPIGADLSNIADTPLGGYRSQEDDRQEEIAQDEASNTTPARAYLLPMGPFVASYFTPEGIQGIEDAVSEQWIGANLARQLGRPGFAPDPSFRYDDELWAQVTEGLPEEYLEGLGGAHSREHALSLADGLRTSYERDTRLGQLGWRGVELQLAAALLDPVSIAVSLGTEGAAAPYVYGAKLTKLSRFVRAGVLAGGTNAALDGYLASQDPVSSWDGLAYSAAAGFVLGGMSGAFRGLPEDDALEDAMGTFMRAKELEADERALPTAVTPPPATPTSAPDGSIGAARVPPGANETPAEYVARQTDGAPRPTFAAARIDATGVLMKSENGITRTLAPLLGENAVGNADGSAVVVAVTERAGRELRVRLARVARVYDSSFKEWAEGKGYNWWQVKAQPAARAAFNREVGLAVRRELDATQNPASQRLAGVYKRELADLLQFGKDKGVRGFDELSENYNYLSRQHNVQALDNMMERFGSSAVHNMVAASLRSANRRWLNRNTGAAAAGGRELDVEDALKIAGAYVRSIRSRRFGSFDIGRALGGHDQETLREILAEGGVDIADANRIVDDIRAGIDNGDRGRIAPAKHRLDLDETFKTDLYDQRTGQLVRNVGVEDFLENDIELLFGNYANRVVRSGYLEDALSNFKVPLADGSMPRHAPSFETIRGYIVETSRLAPGKQKGELRALERLYKQAAGVPLDDSGTTFATVQRAVRDYNFVRLGGQFGISALAEVGSIIGNGGFRVLLQNVPEMRKMIFNAKTGRFSDDLQNDIEAIWGLGTDYLRSSPNVRADEGFIEGRAVGGRGKTFGVSNAVWGDLDFKLQQGKNAVAMVGGMAPVTMALQRLSGRVLIQRFVDNAIGVSDINVRRLRALGINDAMMGRINAQLGKATLQKGLLGQKIRRLNIEQWDDIDAKNAFINAVDRWSRRVVQENDPGAMPYFMSFELGKSLFNLRSFMLGAYTKMTLAGMHMRDIETANAWMMAMFFGGLFYVGQAHVNSIGRPNREEWLNERLAGEEIAKAAFTRAGFSSLLPMLADTAVASTGLEPVFNYRSSGLGSDIVTGSPVYDLGKQIGAAVSGGLSAAVNPGYDYSQQDFKALQQTLFLQNAFVIRNALQAIGGTLPRFSQ